MNHNLNLIYKKYSEEELECNISFFNKFDWNSISFYQNLSEEFIEKYSDKLDWCWISRHQKLSESFIMKNIYKINVRLLMWNKDISEEIKEEIKTLKEII